MLGKSTKESTVIQTTTKRKYNQWENETNTCHAVMEYKCICNDKEWSGGEEVFVASWEGHKQPESIIAWMDEGHLIQL